MKRTPILAILFMNCAYHWHSIHYPSKFAISTGQYRYSVFKNGELQGDAAFVVSATKNGYEFVQLLRSRLVFDSFNLATDSALMPISSHRIARVADKITLVNLRVNYWKDSIVIKGMAGKKKYNSRVIKVKGKVVDYGELVYILPDMAVSGIRDIPVFIPELARVEWGHLSSFSHEDSSLTIYFNLRKEHLEFDYKIVRGKYIPYRVYNVKTRSLMVLKNKD